LLRNDYYVPCNRFDHLAAKARSMDIQPVTRATKAPLLFRTLHAIGATVPGGFPHSTAVGNRILRKLYNATGRDGTFRILVWNGLLFDVDPRDTIGGNLSFAPRAFEYTERRYLERTLPRRGCFVDVGANIGIFTLFAARLVGDEGRVIAIEPDPVNWTALLEHIRLNRMQAVITPVNLGVSSRRELLHVTESTPTNRGATNRGATSLTADGNGPLVECVPLSELLESAGCERIDVLKIDIEGGEFPVLERFFADVRESHGILPRHLIVESVYAPTSDRSGYQQRLTELICEAGYRMDRRGLNSFYSLA
jgi:FkbM family methyltransferase